MHTQARNAVKQRLHNMLALRLAFVLTLALSLMSYSRAMQPRKAGQLPTWTN